MPTANDKLLNKEVAHAIDTLGYSNDVTKKIISILNKSDVNLFAQLTKELDKINPNTFKIARLDQLLQSVRKINSQAYAEVSKTLDKELKGFSASEVDYQQRLIKSVQPSPVLPISPETVYAAAMDTPFQGKLLSEFLTGLEDGKATLIRDAVRMGVIESQTTNEIVKKIRGTAALKYNDGILNITRANAESVVLTAVAHTANMAQQQVYEANSDIIKGYRYTATLDTRTTELCASRDGNFYKIGAPKPAIPAHFRCRSRYVPVLKSFRELGLDVDLPESTRASLDGQVPAKMNYQQWLSKQSLDRQITVLGKEKAILFNQGKLTLDKFVSPAGHVYTLKELEQMNGKLLGETTPAVATNKTWNPNTKWAKLHDDSFAGSPNFIKNAIIKYDDQLKEVQISGGGAHYNARNKFIKNPDTIDLKTQGTWRHEYGHFIDNILSGTPYGFRSSAKDFDDILKAETETVLANAGFARKSAKQTAFNIERQNNINAFREKFLKLNAVEADNLVASKAKEIGVDINAVDTFFNNETTYIATELDTKYRKAQLLDALKNKDAAMFMVSINGDAWTNHQIFRKGNVGKFSDLIGSASRNKLLGFGSHGVGGHKNSYYKSAPENANTEVFANLTALYGSDNTFWHTVVDTFYPETGKLYKGILSE